MRKRALGECLVGGAGFVEGRRWRAGCRSRGTVSIGWLGRSEGGRCLAVVGVPVGGAAPRRHGREGGPRVARSDANGDWVFGGRGSAGWRSACLEDEGRRTNLRDRRGVLVRSATCQKVGATFDGKTLIVLDGPGGDVAMAGRCGGALAGRSVGTLRHGKGREKVTATAGVRGRDSLRGRRRRAR